MIPVNDERSGDRAARSPSLKSLGYYLLVIALLGWTASKLLDARLSDVQLFAVALFAIPYIFLPLALFSQKWWVLAASFLFSAASIKISRLRYLPIVVALASWLLMHLLNFVTQWATLFVEIVQGFMDFDVRPRVDGAILSEMAGILNHCSLAA